MHSGAPLPPPQSNGRKRGSPKLCSSTLRFPNDYEQDGERGKHLNYPSAPTFSPPFLGKDTQFLAPLQFNGGQGTKQKLWPYKKDLSEELAWLVETLFFPLAAGLEPGWAGWVSRTLLGSQGDLKDGSHVQKREEHTAQHQSL